MIPAAENTYNKLTGNDNVSKAQKYNINVSHAIVPLSVLSADAGLLVTFCVSRRRHKMYCGHAHLSVRVSVCLSAAVCPHYCTDLDVA